MASPAAPILAERADIHKSCKSLETIVNAFNDYCQLADSLAAAQKKLAKSLREATGLKGTGNMAANAMSTVAGLFECLAEVDAKYVKIADKECESVSTELKKWFKKLAKEEKSHDDKIAAANTRIKQAGQAYEKKAKKKDRDAADEHTRYVQVLSVIGPEMSQDKYNHALFVTQRHATTVYAVASALARMADAEWMRACECVRRFSPAVGQIGECRAFLEGGWTRAVPSDLPDIEAGLDPVHERERDTAEKISTPESAQVLNMPKGSHALTDYEVTTLSRTSPTHVQQPLSSSPNDASQPTLNVQSITAPPPSSFPPLAAPKRPFVDRDKNTSVRSIESLSSFPSPPTHFPLPSIQSATSTSTSGPSSEPSQTPSSVEPISAKQPPFLVPQGEMQTHGQVEATPALTDDSHSPVSLRADLSTPPTYTTSPAVLKNDEKERSGKELELSDSGHSNTAAGSMNINARRHDEGHSTEEATVRFPARESPYTKGDYFLGNEPDSPSQRDLRQPVMNKETDANTSANVHNIERTTSVASTGSVVAAMRDRWLRPQNASPISSQPASRDVPRLPQSVTDLANRYTPLDNLPTPTRDPTMLVPDRQRESPRQDRRTFLAANSDASASTSPISAPPTEGVTSRHQRMEDLEVLELREHEYQLRERAREIDMREIDIRARELELERTRLLNSRASLETYANDSKRNFGLTSPQNGARQGALAGATRPSSYTRNSYSTTDLIRPFDSVPDHERPTSRYDRARAPQTQPSSPATPRPTDHAPFCGCRACSVAQYSSSTTSATAAAHDTRPPEPPIALRAEKPKGWMRRLSMPVVVGNAFSSDSKKNDGMRAGTSGSSSSMGVGGRGSMNMALPAEDGRIMRRSFERDATGGISNVRPRKISFGRR